MNAREVHLLGSLRSAHQFITTHAAALGAVPSCGAHRRLSAGLERAIAYANTQAAAQVCARSATRVLHERRTELLRDHLAPLVAIAAEQLRRGRRTTHVLDAMVRSTTRDNPVLFEAWRGAITPVAAAVRSRPEVEEVRIPEATPAPELAAPPTLVSVKETAQVQAKPRLLQLWRGPVRRRWAA